MRPIECVRPTPVDGAPNPFLRSARTGEQARRNGARSGGPLRRGLPRPGVEPGGRPRDQEVAVLWGAAGLVAAPAVPEESAAAGVARHGALPANSPDTFPTSPAVSATGRRPSGVRRLPGRTRIHLAETPGFARVPEISGGESGGEGESALCRSRRAPEGRGIPRRSAVCRPHGRKARGASFPVRIRFPWARGVTAPDVPEDPDEWHVGYRCLVAGRRLSCSTSPRGQPSYGSCCRPDTMARCWSAAVHVARPRVLATWLTPAYEGVEESKPRPWRDRVAAALVPL